jgi:hypothetical protein
MDVSPDSPNVARDDMRDSPRDFGRRAITRRLIASRAAGEEMTIFAPATTGARFRWLHYWLTVSKYLYTFSIVIYRSTNELLIFSKLNSF